MENRSNVNIEAIQWDGTNLEQIRDFLGKNLVSVTKNDNAYPEEYDDCFDIRVNTITGVVRLLYGYYVVKFDSIKPTYLLGIFVASPEVFNNIQKDMVQGTKQSVNYYVFVDRLPESCTKCNLFQNYYSDMSCRQNNRSIDYPYPDTFRQQWCPLKVLPEPNHTLYDKEYWDGYQYGWNSYRDTLLGMED